MHSTKNAKILQITNARRRSSRSNDTFEQHYADNGARILWCDSQIGHDKLGYMSVSFSVGFDSDPSRPEIAHVTEHILADLTSIAYPDETKNREVLDSLGLVTNAWTSLTRTAYHASGTVDAIIDTYAPMMVHTFENRPAFINPKVLSTELGAIIRELEIRMDQSWHLTNQTVRRELFPGIHSIMERIEYVKTLSKDQANAARDIRRFIQRYYTADRCFIILSSRQSCKERMIASAMKIVQTLTSTRSKSTLPIEIIASPQWRSDVVYIDEPNTTTANCIVIRKLQNITQQEHDRKKCAAFHAISSALQVRLMKVLRTQLGLVYSVHSTLAITECNGASFLEIQTNCHPRNVEVILSNIEDAFQIMTSVGITDAELFSYKNGSYRRLLTTHSSGLPELICGLHDNEVATGRLLYEIDEQHEHVNGLTRLFVLDSIHECLSEQKIRFVGKARLGK
jgi:predicted Zn-dependent peptidase